MTTLRLVGEWLGGEDGQTLFRGGAESFAELREGWFAEAFGEEREERVRDERQVGQQVGLTGTATVFAHPGIASPMIADFGPAPMSSDEVQPFLGRIRIRWRAGEVVTGLGAGETILVFVRWLRTTIRARAKGKSTARGSMGKAWSWRISTRP